MASIQTARLNVLKICEVHHEMATIENMNNAEIPEPNNSINESILLSNKISALEKSITFLKSQHEIMLRGLQSEIEKLRIENKSLQFRIVMCCCSPATNKSSPRQNNMCDLPDASNTGTSCKNHEDKHNNKKQQFNKSDGERNVSLSETVIVIKDGKNSMDNIFNAETQELRPPFAAVSISKNTIDEKRDEMTTLSHPAIHELEPFKSQIHRNPATADCSEISQSVRMTSPKALDTTVTTIPIFSPKLSAESSSVFDLPSKVTEGSKNAVPVKITVPEVRISSKASEMHSNHNVSSGIMGQRLFPVTLPLLKTERHSAKLMKFAPKCSLAPRMSTQTRISAPCLDSGICFEKSLVNRVYKVKSATKHHDVRDSYKSNEANGILQHIGDQNTMKKIREDQRPQQKLNYFRPKHSRNLYTSHMPGGHPNPGPFLPALTNSTHMTDQAPRIGKTSELPHKRVDHIKDTFSS